MPASGIFVYYPMSSGGNTEPRQAMPMPYHTPVASKVKDKSGKEYIHNNIKKIKYLRIILTKETKNTIE